ncbi:C1q-related factor-like [Dreissena polymorpha]|uniref:C1q domain-containing protein n=1 Tax=Dreissena polymorpha TaxID=45954 RepID=A0A9D3Z3Y1_DREPO|nr:C1q-related factor-like [Dreissena polymorpha]KAH3710151.1 hypothetical protein DPMN_069620 [Dreissena polymorpha]
MLIVKVFVFLLFLGIGRSAPLDAQDLLQKIDELTERLAALENNKRAIVEGPVAFTATLVNTIEHVGDHQHIVFDRVITNIGDGYSPVSGHFTAPVRGAYALSVVLTNTPGHAASVVLIRNGQSLGQVLADDESNVAYTTSTLAITAQLEAGDQLWVQNEYTFSGQEQIDQEWTYFSGHLIQQN